MITPSFSEKLHGTYYIYGLVDLADGLVYHVGKTNNLFRRWIEHVSKWNGAYYNSRERWLYDVIINRDSLPLMITFESIDNPTVYQLDVLEMEWMKRCIDDGMPIASGEASPYYGRSQFRSLHALLHSGLLDEDAYNEVYIALVRMLKQYRLKELL